MSKKPSKAKPVPMWHRALLGKKLLVEKGPDIVSINQDDIDRITKHLDAAGFKIVRKKKRRRAK